MNSAAREPGGGAPRPEVLGFFPTPAYLAELPRTEALNAELKRIILEREAGEAGLDNSNVGGWHSGRDFAEWGGPALQQVLEAAKSLATQLTRDRKGRAVRPEWQVECWANINRSGQANKRHTHPGCFWSGTYYVDDGGVADHPRYGGAFEFQDPRGVAPALAGDLLYREPHGSNSAPAETEIRPRSGLMVLFPSWMPHAVRAYSGPGQRISIAFNFARN